MAIERHHGSLRGEIDDAPAARRHHRLGDSLCHEERGLEVHAHGGIPPGFRDVDRLVQNGDAGAVDQMIDAAVARDHRVDGALDFGEFAHIQGNAQMPVCAARQCRGDIRYVRAQVE